MTREETQEKLDQLAIELNAAVNAAWSEYNLNMLATLERRTKRIDAAYAAYDKAVDELYPNNPESNESTEEEAR